MRSHPLRLALLALASILIAAPPAAAQITLSASTVPFTIGTGAYTSASASGEDGTNGDLIAGLVAAAGPNQVWDFTALGFSESFEGEFTTTQGAVGPGAEETPLDQATLTLVHPFRVKDPKEPFVGTGYFYYRFTPQAWTDLGLVIQSDGPDDDVLFSVKNLPSGAISAPASYTFGTTWSNAFTQVIDFGFFEFSAEVTQLYEVDGWGALVVPGAATTPALRVKLTQSQSVFGETFTTVSYEFRTATTLSASLFPGDEKTPASADIARFGSGSSTPSGATPGERLALSAPSPNPFAQVTAFEVSLPHAERLRVSVHDVLGREVAVLTDAPWPAGRHAFTFDGSSLPSGVYIVRVQSGTSTGARRVTLAR